MIQLSNFKPEKRRIQFINMSIAQDSLNKFDRQESRARIRNSKRF